MKPIVKKKDELFFIRVTTKDETMKKNPKKFGHYWRFVERRDRLKRAIEQNTAYIIDDTEEPYVIIGKGKYSELEFDRGISKINDGEQAFSAKWLFNKTYIPSVRILYKGSVKNILKKL